MLLEQRLEPTLYQKQTKRKNVTFWREYIYIKLCVIFSEFRNSICVRYECVLLIVSVTSPILRDDWTLFSSLQTAPGPVSECCLSPGLGISSVPRFQFHRQWTVARRLVAPLLRAAWLQGFYHCHVSPHHHADEQGVHGALNLHWLHPCTRNSCSVQN